MKCPFYAIEIVNEDEKAEEFFIREVLQSHELLTANLESYPTLEAAQEAAKEFEFDIAFVGDYFEIIEQID